MRRLALLTLPALLAACSLVSPYKITFTTQENAVVDPASTTLDFVVSSAALAYISEVDCDGADDIELLPVVTDEMTAKTAYNLSLEMLNGAPGAECEIVVTAFDQTTTATATGEISVVIAGEAVETDESTEETTEESTEEAVEETTVDESTTEDTTAVEEAVTTEVEVMVDGE